jgi:cob(I)alamin adenosyltransferase
MVKQRLKIPKISNEDIERLEKEMDVMEDELTTNDTFCFTWRTSNRVILSHSPNRLP